MKRTLLIFGIVGSFFFASCGDGNNNDNITSETETFDNRYDTGEEGLANNQYDDLGYGTDEYGNTGQNTIGDPTLNNGTTMEDNTYANNQTGTMGTLGSTQSGQYVCLDSTLVSDVGY